MKVRRKNVGNSKVFRLSINRYAYALMLTGAIVFGLVYLYPKLVIPVERVGETSTLIMQGDLDEDGDRKHR